MKLNNSVFKNDRLQSDRYILILTDRVEADKTSCLTQYLSSYWPNYLLKVLRLYSINLFRYASIIFHWGEGG